LADAADGLGVSLFKRGRDGCNFEEHLVGRRSLLLLKRKFSMKCSISERHNVLRESETMCAAQYLRVVLGSSPEVFERLFNRAIGFGDFRNFLVAAGGHDE
jgi:hypothetical protein